MKELSSWGSVEPEYVTPPAVKKKIARNVRTQLSLMKFITGVFDLYVGKAGETILGLAQTMQMDDEEQEELKKNNFFKKQNPK